MSGRKRGVCGMFRIASLLCVAIIALTPAVAQQAQTAGIVTFDLFTGESFDLDPDEARKLLDAALFAEANKMKAG